MIDDDMAFLDYEVQSEILVCKCGGKYIKVFLTQHQCPRCIKHIWAELKTLDNMIYESKTIHINGNYYPVAKCPVMLNGKRCNTAMNPARKVCTHCEKHADPLEVGKLFI